MGAASGVRRWGAFLTAVVALATVPAAARAQAVQLRLGYGVSSLSTPTWTPVYGPELSVEFALGRAWGAGVALGGARRHRGEVERVCGFATCSEGPYDEDVYLRSVGVGVVRRVTTSASVDVTAALRLRIVTQGRHMTHQLTSEEFDRSESTDTGLGAAAEVRLRRTALGLAPFTWLAVDRVFAGDCLLDAACYGDRTHAQAGLGLSFGVGPSPSPARAERR